LASVILPLIVKLVCEKHWLIEKITENNKMKLEKTMRFVKYDIINYLDCRIVSNVGLTFYLNK
jgi:hypothetical protein